MVLFYGFLMAIVCVVVTLLVFKVVGYFITKFDYAFLFDNDIFIVAIVSILFLTIPCTIYIDSTNNKKTDISNRVIIFKEDGKRMSCKQDNLKDCVPYESQEIPAKLLIRKQSPTTPDKSKQHIKKIWIIYNGNNTY